MYAPLSFYEFSFWTKQTQVMSLYNTYSILLHDTVDHVILYGFSGVGVKHEMVRSCLIKVNWDLSETDQKLKE